MSVPMTFPPLCSGRPTDMGDGSLIDGVTEEQHQWVEGSGWEGPGPVGEASVQWSELVCERCGAISAAWSRPPEGGDNPIDGSETVAP